MGPSFSLAARTSTCAKSLKSLAALALLAACGSCSSNESVPAPSTSTDQTGQSTQSVEWVSFHTEVPLAPSAFHSLASGLFGADAQSGKFVTNQEISTGIFLGGAADPSTPEQTSVTFAFDDGTNAAARRSPSRPPRSPGKRVHLRPSTPRSRRCRPTTRSSPGSGESFLLEYRVTSSQGGTLSFGVHGNRASIQPRRRRDARRTRASRRAASARPRRHASRPTTRSPGTVWFHLTKDDFDFFVAHAYGQGATPPQNFNDFRSTRTPGCASPSTPHLEQQFVNVASTS